MTAKSYLRGHPIEHNGTEWIYSDTKESTVQTHKERDCGRCKRKATPEGHDPCLGTLPHVMNACCGHGMIKEAYVQFWNKETIHGTDALKIMTALKGRGE